MSLTEDLDLLLLALDVPNANVMFVTGAGISVASGIPTFRGNDPDAVWANDVMEKGTFRYFRRDPVGSWSWYLSRFDGCRSASPNPGHDALVEIENSLTVRGANSLLVTQNVDGLHRVAGSHSMIEVHGSARHVRCIRRMCVNAAPKGVLEVDEVVFARFRDDPSEATLPRCPACGELLRPHVLWFDEMYTDHETYGIESILGFVDRPASALVFVGTSFAVGLTEMLLGAARRHSIPAFAVDPFLQADSSMHVDVLPWAAEVFLPALAERLSTLQG